MVAVLMWAFLGVAGEELFLVASSERLEICQRAKEAVALLYEAEVVLFCGLILLLFLFEGFE
jgi:hypothetical protein